MDMKGRRERNMKTATNRFQNNAHAATTRVAGTCAQNLAESADSQFKSSSIVTNEGLLGDEEVVAAWKSTRIVIASILTRFHLLADLDDVHQETFLRMCEQRERYNPLRSDFGTFARVIAKSVTYNHLTRRFTAREETVDESVLVDILDSFTHFGGSEFKPVAYTVLKLLRSAAGTTDFFRAVEIAVWFNGNAEEAAKVWDIPARTVRDARERVHRIGRVIMRALLEHEWRQVHGIVEPASVATLAACLPTESGSLSYLKALAEVGSVEALSIDRLMELTGLSRHSAKKHAARTKKLLSIARSVVETGNLATEEEV